MRRTIFSIGLLAVLFIGLAGLSTYPVTANIVDPPDDPTPTETTPPPTETTPPPTETTPPPTETTPPPTETTPPPTETTPPPTATTPPPTATTPPPNIPTPDNPPPVATTPPNTLQPQVYSARERILQALSTKKPGLVRRASDILRTVIQEITSQQPTPATERRLLDASGQGTPTALPTQLYDLCPNYDGLKLFEDMGCPRIERSCSHLFHILPSWGSNIAVISGTFNLRYWIGEPGLRPLSDRHADLTTKSYPSSLDIQFSEHVDSENLQYTWKIQTEFTHRDVMYVAYCGETLTFNPDYSIAHVEYLNGATIADVPPSDPIIVPTSTPSVSPPISTTPTLTVLAPLGVNIRIGDSIEYAVIGTLSQGESREIIGISTSNRWYVINYNGVHGFMTLDPALVAVSGDISGLDSIPSPTLIIPSGSNRYVYNGSCVTELIATDIQEVYINSLLAALSGSLDFEIAIDIGESVPIVVRGLNAAIDQINRLGVELPPIPGSVQIIELGSLQDWLENQLRSTVISIIGFLNPSIEATYQVTYNYDGVSISNITVLQRHSTQLKGMTSNFEHEGATQIIPQSNLSFEYGLLNASITLSSTHDISIGISYSGVTGLIGLGITWQHKYALGHILAICTIEEETLINHAIRQSQ